MSDRQSAVEAVDTATLEPLVREALGEPDAQITDWGCHPIQGAPVGRPQARGDEAPAATDANERRRQTAVDKVRRQFAAQQGDGRLGRRVYRFTGAARIQKGTVDWSLILKVQEDSTQRERRAFESGLLSDLPEGVVCPQCYATAEFSDGAYWLWLEEIKDEVDGPWQMEHFELAARHLGRFNGIHLTERSLPTAPWLGTKPGANWDQTEDVLSQLRSVRHHPLVALAFPEDVAKGVERLWANRKRLHAALMKLPMTLSHLDSHRGNLMSRHSYNGSETVLIDWGSIGTAAIGVEIHQLTASFRSLRDLEIDRVKELSDIVFDGFLAGLRDVGWQGDVLQLRLGYAISVALCNGLGELRSLMKGGLDEGARDRVRELWGDRPIEENMARRGELLRFILDLGREAEALIDRI